MVEFFGRHPEVFQINDGAIYCKMITYLWHERSKGEASFWKPYLDIINFSDLPLLWKDEELHQF